MWFFKKKKSSDIEDNDSSISVENEDKKDIISEISDIRNNLSEITKNSYSPKDDEINKIDDSSLEKRNIDSEDVNDEPKNLQEISLERENNLEDASKEGLKENPKKDNSENELIDNYEFMIERFVKESKGEWSSSRFITFAHDVKSKGYSKSLYTIKKDLKKAIESDKFKGQIKDVVKNKTNNISKKESKIVEKKDFEIKLDLPEKEFDILPTETAKVPTMEEIESDIKHSNEVLEKIEHAPKIEANSKDKKENLTPDDEINDLRKELDLISLN